MIKEKPVMPTKKRVAILVQYILDYGVNYDGSMPKEQELCDHLGWSRMTLRESLAVLDWEGVIIREPCKRAKASPEFKEILKSSAFEEKLK